MLGSDGRRFKSYKLAAQFWPPFPPIRNGVITHFCEKDRK